MEVDGRVDAELSTPDAGCMAISARRGRELGIARPPRTVVAWQEALHVAQQRIDGRRGTSAHGHDAPTGAEEHDCQASSQAGVSDSREVFAYMPGTVALATSSALGHHPWRLRHADVTRADAGST